MHNHDFQHISRTPRGGTHDYKCRRCGLHKHIVYNKVKGYTVYMFAPKGTVLYRKKVFHASYPGIHLMHIGEKIAKLDCDRIRMLDLCS